MKRNKEKDGKKGMSETSCSAEKFSVKRRSSLTGSVMDTSSSSTSNSSVESDESEIFDRSVNNTEDMEKCSMSVRRLSVAEPDATATAFKHRENNEAGNGNNKRSALNTDKINVTVGKEAERWQHSKKQTRREKRKKRKEKEKLRILECDGKGSTDIPDNSVIIQKVLHLAKDSNYSERSLIDTVKMSFGELQNSKKGSAYSSSTIGKNEVKITNNSDMLHVYTTGHELRELLQSHEKDDAFSKFRLSLDEKMGNSLIGALPATSRKSNINEFVEFMPTKFSVKKDLFYILFLCHILNIKVGQKYAQWTRTFHKAILDGDKNTFTRKFNCLVRILRKSVCNVHYQCLDERRCKERIIMNILKLTNFLSQGILAHFSEQNGTYTIIHQLAATRNVQKCGIFGVHNKCRMIKTLLDGLSQKNRRNILCLQMHKNGKTPLHIAAESGQPCQIEALMYYEAPADVLDFSKRAPIHYAVLRKDVYTTKMLLWYGADMAVLRKNHFFSQLSSMSSNNSAVGFVLLGHFYYIKIGINCLCALRKKALEDIFMKWTKLFVRGIWSPYKSFTDLHFIRLASDGISQSGNSITKKRTVDLNVLYNVKQNPDYNKYPLSLLFIIPTFYKSADFYSDASNPQIYCTPLTFDSTDDIVELIKCPPVFGIYNSKEINTHEISLHLIYFLLHVNFLFHLSFNVDVHRIRDKVKHIVLAVQGIICGPPDFCIWNKIKKEEKAKLD
uniref:ANK_REP_REGION domain-containing protein n=1 Tax=Syphacia muris TaxID=451379 RepID=A0A0N5AZC9_9BILA